MSGVDHPLYDVRREKIVAAAYLTSVKDRDIKIKKGISFSMENGKDKSEQIKTRESLPARMIPRSEVSFWAVLKSCIGKDLSQITFPVQFNEPLSFVQRLAQPIEYTHLLRHAAKSDDPMERMECVVAFSVAVHSSTWERMGKPFNPLLGETFALDRPDIGVRYLAEQVSHHPPITAYHLIGKGYQLYGSVQPKLKFWGKHIDVTPKGFMHFHLDKYDETYTWSGAGIVVHNIITGNLWIEHVGHVEVVCNKSSIQASLEYKSSGWSNKYLHAVEGTITSFKKPQRVVYGSWPLGMYSCSPEDFKKFMDNDKLKSDTLAKLEEAAVAVRKATGLTYPMTYNYGINGQRTILSVKTRPSNSKFYYNFSSFTMSLNEMLPNLEKDLCPTDCRLRPDVRALEEGHLVVAENEKLRLESKQRAARAERKKKNQEWVPLWFRYTRNPVTGKEDWCFNGRYWEKDWSKCPNLY